MMKIGKTYLVRDAGMSRLCADIIMDRHKTTLWFAVDSKQEEYLCVGRADAFVMALLPAAMRSGNDLICEDVLSERLHYQMCDYLMPTLEFAGDLYHQIRIKAPLTTQKYFSHGAVGTGFSGGIDCLYTIMQHGEKCEFPLTHIAVFNSGVFEGEKYRNIFTGSCQKASCFAQEQGLQTVFVDSNIKDVLPERFLDVYSFRNLAFALALQGLFSIYLLSSGHDAGNFKLDLRNTATYDVLTVNCASTESMSFYLSGAETKRWKKIDELTHWEASWKWLHPCISIATENHNCGRCRKCIRDMTTLYALGQLEHYDAVFDIKDYKRHFSERVAFVMANRGNHLFDETLELLERRKVDIPQKAYLYEKQFRRAVQNLERRQRESILYE